MIDNDRIFEVFLSFEMILDIGFIYCYGNAAVSFSTFYCLKSKHWYQKYENLLHFQRSLLFKKILETVRIIRINSKCDKCTRQQSVRHTGFPFMIVNSSKCHITSISTHHSRLYFSSIGNTSFGFSNHKPRQWSRPAKVQMNNLRQL